MQILTTALRPHWLKLVVAVVMNVVAALELLPHALVYLAAVDVFASPPRSDRFVSLAVVGFVGVVARYLLLGGGLLMTCSVAFSALGSIRLRVVDHLARATARALDDQPPGDLKKAIVEDVDALEGIVAHNLPDLVSGLVVPVVGFVVLLFVDERPCAPTEAL